ncbi:PepSY domain-containing protein [Tahibacter sp.]|uniref:PepSY domain-containing protein n=1 Tax=Tahibacter sp. TaxID=2056211 RepID=UPI0028C4D0A4|nr:PepSY domain-containing protein [Tahibacter sp.]
MSRLVVAALVAAASLMPALASASPVCTKEPESKWIPEAQMKEKIAQMGYQRIKVFKKTATGCYEIYGYNAKGARAEVYFNPVTGAIVRENIDN